MRIGLAITSIMALLFEEHRGISVPAGPVVLCGDLNIPEGARGIVLFAHGSGSSRLSPRNRGVARVLNEGRLTTLLVDLLTSDEEAIDEVTRELRFNIDMLAERLIGATRWLSRHSQTAELRIGYFGASTGAAAALVAAANVPDLVGAVVSRGGRVDLAAEALERVQAPTLLIVGGEDDIVLALNRQSLTRLRTNKKLVIIRGATHLFEEPGALDIVAQQARDWFECYLAAELTEQPSAPTPA